MYRQIVMLSGCLIFASLNTIWADNPSADYIFPAGGQRGTTVEFRVGAHFLHGGAPFEMSGKGLVASKRIERTQTIWFEGPMVLKPKSQAGENYPKDHTGRVTIAPDAQLGVHYWRLWTSQGAVDSKPFIVGNLPEIVEQEIDGQPIPTHVPLPVTINGRIFPREDVDLWQFKATSGQSITCEVRASRLGSPLDSRLEVYDPQGNCVADNTDFFGTDSFLRFVAPMDGTYQIKIYDSLFRGLQQYVYRLTVTTDSYVDQVYPLGGRLGSTVHVQLSGQKVPSKSLEIELQPRSPGIIQQRFPIDGILSNPVLFDVSSWDEHLEQEPNNSSEQKNQPIIVPPAVLNGRIDYPTDRDLWEIQVSKGQLFQLSVTTVRFGSLLDAVVRIMDPTGKQLTQFGASPSNPAEAKTQFTFPEDGLFRIEIQDLFPDRGGPRYAYRLKIEPPDSPDFRLTLPSDALTVLRNEQTKFKVAVERLNGMKGDISLQVKGLPEDVHVNTATISSDKKEAELTFNATKKAKIHTSYLTIFGAATIGNTKQTRQAILSSPTGVPVRQNVLLAVAMPTPFKLDGVEFQTSYAARGTTHRRRFRIDWGNYKGPLQLLLADRQIRHLQGVTGPMIEVPHGQPEVFYPLFVPTWLEMNRTSRSVVMAVGIVKDEDGVPHHVSFSSGAVKDQVIMLTAPCPLNIRAQRLSFRAIPHQSVEVPVTIARGILKPAPVIVELLVPTHIRGLRPERLTIASNNNTGNLTIHFEEKLGPFNMPVRIRATTTVGNDRVIAETNIEFVSSFTTSTR